MTEDSSLKEWKEYYDNKRIKRQEFYRAGIPEGEHKQWYEPYLLYEPISWDPIYIKK